MKHSEHLSRLDRLSSSNRSLLLIVLIIGISVWINILTTISLISKENFILVPPGLQTQAGIQKDKADEQYLIASTRSVLNLLLNYTPATIKDQYEELLMLYDADTQPATRTQFYNLVENAKMASVSSLFVPQKFVVNQAESWIKALGGRKLYRQDLTEPPQTAVFQINYKIQNYRFIVKDIKEVDKI